jgi:glycosyltransferase involved in cell wall biosynthesis
MRIHLVSEHASPLALLGGVDAGGQNVHVADLARALGRLGAEVVVHTRRDDPSLPRRVPFAPNVVVDHVDAGPAAPLPKDELLPHMDDFAADLSDEWRRRRPDVVHAHFWMSGLASVRAATPLGVPVALTYHALGVVKRRNQGALDTSPAERLAVEARLARTVDRVVATTEDEACELRSLGTPGPRISVVPCGVDLDRFRPDGPVRERSSRPRILIVSRLVERKGIGNVITALADVPGAELVVAGGPPAGLVEDDEQARRYLTMARELGLRDRVELLGAVERDGVPALMRSADVVVCCPWYEPFGLTAIEAMACGVPVVATRVGGLAETVRHGRTGWHVPPRDPAAIAAALRSALADRPRLDRVGAEAARHARRYSWDRVAAETLAVARELVAGTGHPGQVTPPTMSTSALGLGVLP